MANEEQLSILKQGVEVWNEWREQNVNANLKRIVICHECDEFDA